VQHPVFGGRVVVVKSFGLPDDGLRHFEGRHGRVDDNTNAVAAWSGVQVNPHTKIAWKWTRKSSAELQKQDSFENQMYEFDNTIFCKLN
jgi:hypothetical protein